MKGPTALLLGLICLCLCIISLAQESPPINALEVQIIGLEGDALKNALQKITDKQKLIADHFTEKKILRLYRDIPKEIQSAIEPFGYFKSRIVRSHIQRQNGTWQAQFYVTPGPRMQFTTVTVSITGSGAADPAFQRLYQNFPIKAGDFFNAKKYEDAKLELDDTASSRGYFNSHMVKSHIYINLSRYTAHVVIAFNTGPRFRFGPTTFSKTPLNPEFLHRFLYYQQGNYYNQNKIQRTRQGLANSNYFSTVLVTPQPEKSKALHVPVTIELQMQPRKQYTLGIGYGTDTGPRGLLGVDMRWINQYGHRFNAFVVGSRINSQAVANYIIPGRNPATDQYIFTGGFLNQDQKTGQGRSGRLAVSYQTEWYGWQPTLSLTALRERYSITGLPYTNANLIYPTFTLQRMHADNLLKPSFGYSLVAQITGASKDILSKTSFGQARIDGRFLFTLWNHTRFITRATGGYTSIQDLDNLPLSLQLFAGGAQSLRGFGYNTIGPGRKLFVGSIEIQQRLYGDIYLAGFFDFGNVANALFNKKLKEGAGPGLVWLSPIGMFEITFACAVSQPNRPWVIQFSMGPAL